MAEQNQANNKRIAKNTIFLYIRMFFILIVSLYTSRVILNVLGVSDYGVYNVVAGFVYMFGFLNATLSSSMQRFYNYEGTQRGERGFMEIYKAGLITHFALTGVLLLLLETFGLWYVNGVMSVPADRLIAANIVYQTSVVSMVFVILQIPYLGAILAKEKMNYYAVISIFDILLKLISIIILPYIAYDKLAIYGILTMLVSVVVFICYFVYAKRNVLDSSIRVNPSRTVYKDLLSFSGWNLLGTFAFMLKGQGLNMLLNYFFGTIVNAARGIAFQVNSALSNFSSNITVAFRPQVIDSYAAIDYNRFERLSFTLSKVCYSLLALLIVPVVLEIDYILHLWLGDFIPENTNIFTILVLVDSLICTPITPFTQMIFAIGNIKKYQIVTSVLNLAIVPVAWIFLYYGANALSVFYITIAFSVANLLLNVVLVKQVFPLNLSSYIKEVIIPCILITILLPVIPTLIRMNMQPSVLRLLLVCFVTVLIFAVILLVLVLNKSERELALSFITKRKIRN